MMLQCLVTIQSINVLIVSGPASQINMVHYYYIYTASLSVSLFLSLLGILSGDRMSFYIQFYHKFPTSLSALVQLMPWVHPTIQNSNVGFETVLVGAR